MDGLRPERGRSSRAWRRAGLAALGALGIVAGSYALAPYAAKALVVALDRTLDACIWLTLSFDADADRWTVLAAISRAVAGMLMTRRALVGLATLVLLSSLALYALQRLLGDEEEEEESSQ
jgi:hypothetical protein